MGSLGRHNAGRPDPGRALPARRGARRVTGRADAIPAGGLIRGTSFDVVPKAGRSIALAEKKAPDRRIELARGLDAADVADIREHDELRARNRRVKALGNVPGRPHVLVA